MKKIFTLSTALLLVGSVFSQGTSVSFCDDFENYQNGDPIAETSSNWNSWGELMSGATAPFADDADVVNINASSGDLSLYFEAVGAGGPQDVILPFGAGAPYTYGFFEFSANFFVNQGTGAYFNFQAENTPGTTWSLDVQMDATGNISFQNGGGATIFLTSTYPMNTWFEIKTVVDLTNNNWEVFIDNQSQGSFTNTVNKIASLDLYPITGHQFYIDDVCYSYSPFMPSIYTYDMSSIGLNLSSNLSLVNTPFTISGDVVNLSATTVNTLDINYSINGGTPVVDNLNGLNLNLFDIHTFNHTINWIPTSAGVYQVAIWASNINGNPDMDTINDIFLDTIHVWNDITVRRPLIETFTSSTCPPCNAANVTAESLFALNPGNHTSIKYQVNFPGTGDPYYTDEIGQRMDYYMSSGASVPRMEIDGGWDQNGNSITQQVLDDYISEPSFVDITASYNINIKTIDIEITIDALEDIQSNNLVVHTAIIEETTYNNYKTNGETQFEHVVKKMVPNASGTPINTIVGGQQNTLNLSHTFVGNYRLPTNANDPIIHNTEHSVEDFSNLMVAVWIQDVTTKEVHQSTISTLGTYTAISYNCINNSCVDPLDGTGQYSSLSACYALCNPTMIEEIKEIQIIYPNPASDKVYISNLKEENILIKFYDIQGKLVLENKFLNKEYVNISMLAKGIYQVKFEGNNLNETRKLIIE